MRECHCGGSAIFTFSYWTQTEHKLVSSKHFLSICFQRLEKENIGLKYVFTTDFKILFHALKEPKAATGGVP